ncbi:MAG: glycosyltransferase family 4 protein [Hyphomicrobiaceae bacterium]
MTAPRIVYLVTEDWAFVRHRLPMARAAREAGFEVHVLTRLSAHKEAIEREGFHAHGLSWRRSSLSPFETLVSIHEVRRKIAEIAPRIVHNVAVKPALIGSMACLGFDVRVVNSIVGLGSVHLATSLRGRALRALVGAFLRVLLNRRGTSAVVQNPDDRAVLEGLGVRPSQIVLIPGSGVDTDDFQPTPEPAGLPVRAAYVGRMLEDKGLRTLVAAHRRLRQRGCELELLLAGEPDPENPTSISAAELESWGREPGITWLGHVEDIRGLWAGVHFAVLPSRREGFPKSLLEAAACGRPMVASNVPGCREIALDGETGLLAEVDDAESFADAMERMVTDGAARRGMGGRARSVVEQHFSARIIGHQTAELYGRDQA